VRQDVCLLCMSVLDFGKAWVSVHGLVGVKDSGSQEEDDEDDWGGFVGSVVPYTAG